MPTPRALYNEVRKYTDFTNSIATDKHMVAYCPFHTDTARNFYINKEGDVGFFICITCGRRGTLGTFQEMINRLR